MAILVSSLPGIHQNSNVTTGGGTDDTSIIQAALNAGPFPLVLIQDGASLVTGLNVNSQTTIQCSNSNCGFYQANASNQPLFRNANRSGSVISDHDITFDGGTYNGNVTNQSGQFEANGNPISTIQFYGVRNIEVKNLTTLKAPYAGVQAGNYSNVNIHDCTLTSNDNTTLQTSGVDIRGPGTSLILKNLTILTGDDSIGINARNYGGSPNVGPYILGGTVTNVTINGIVFQNAWSGIDLISDGAHGYSVNDVYISNLSGTVQNFVLYLNRDLFNTPSNTGVFTNIYVSGSTVTLSGNPAPFGGLIPAGLWLVDGQVNALRLSNFTPATVKFPTANGTATSAILNGFEYGPVTGAVTFNLGSHVQSACPSIVTNGTNISQGYISNITSGNLLVVFSFGFVAGGTSLPTITDTAGTSLTWNARSTFTDGATGHVATVWTATAPATEGHAIKVTYAATMSLIGVEVAEYAAPHGFTIDSALSLALNASVTTVNCPTAVTTKGDTIVGLGSSGASASAVTPGTGYTLRIQGGNLIYCVLEDALQPGSGSYTPSWTQSPATTSYGYSLAFSQNTSGTFAITGNAGIAGATVAYSGTASGSVTADSNGNFIITGLANGSYTVTPRSSTTAFSPTSQSATVNNADVTAVTFTQAGSSGNGIIGIGLVDERWCSKMLP